MSARPWGTTGRVTLDQCDCLSDGTGDGVHVFVDGQMVGGVDGDPPHRTYLHGRAILRGVETIDQGVMAIIRRAAPDVWRQERGPVWRVKSGSRGNCLGCKYHWLVHTPSGEIASGMSGTGDASGWRWCISLVNNAVTKAATP